jgi:hypothetical protein
MNQAPVARKAQGGVGGGRKGRGGEGARHSRVKDKVGETYGLLEVVELDRANDTGERQAKWRCRCHCGCGREDVVVRTGDLGRSTRSCGSLRQEHGRRSMRRVNERRRERSRLT